MKKAIIITLVHLAIVLSLGGKLLYDRATRPRVWVKTVALDPDLPIRGRYVELRLAVQAPWFTPDPKQYKMDSVELSVRNGELVASKTDADTGNTISTWRGGTLTASLVALDQQVAFYLPEHAVDPSRHPRGQELWAEVTLPRKGPPRPIQLALKDKDGWHPLNLH